MDIDRRLRCMVCGKYPIKNRYCLHPEFYVAWEFAVGENILWMEK